MCDTRCVTRAKPPKCVTRDSRPKRPRRKTVRWADTVPRVRQERARPRPFHSFSLAKGCKNFPGGKRVLRVRPENRVPNVLRVVAWRRRQGLHANAAHVPGAGWRSSSGASVHYRHRAGTAVKCARRHRPESIFLAASSSGYKNEYHRGPREVQKGKYRERCVHPPAVGQA